MPELEGLNVPYTKVFIPVDGGYVVFVEELPGANTQGDTLEEARENLEEAIALILEVNEVLRNRSSQHC